MGEIIKIRLLAFGAAREIIGTRDTLLEIEPGTDCLLLRKTLETTFPLLKSLGRYALAVNHSYVDDDKVLNVDDEVAIIPPVSGG